MLLTSAIEAEAWFAVAAENIDSSGSSTTPGFSSNNDVVSFTKMRRVPTVILCVLCQCFIIAALSNVFGACDFRFEAS